MLFFDEAAGLCGGANDKINPAGESTGIVVTPTSSEEVEILTMGAGFELTSAVDDAVLGATL